MKGWQRENEGYLWYFFVYGKLLRPLITRSSLLCVWRGWSSAVTWFRGVDLSLPVQKKIWVLSYDFHLSWAWELFSNVNKLRGELNWESWYQSGFPTPIYFFRWAGIRVVIWYLVSFWKLKFGKTSAAPNTTPSTQTSLVRWIGSLGLGFVVVEEFREFKTANDF